MPTHAAAKIQEIKTPGGLTAWLMESRNLPMLSVEVNFRAGAAFEPAGKEGLAQFTASLFDEGAGPYNATEFKEELEAIGARFGGSADTLDIGVHLTTLTQHQDRAFELMGLAVREPQFADEAIERIRSQLEAGLKRMAEDPGATAGRLLRPTLFKNQPWANDGDGSEKSLAGITRKDIMGWHLANLTQKNMTISVVGDISASTLATLLDNALLGLPKGSTRRGAELPTPAVAASQTVTQTLAVPQGTVLLGWKGIARSNPDYATQVVMNEIFGGGVLTSRLGLDVREKHGLVYGISARNHPLPNGGFFLITFATDAKKVEKALSLVGENIAKMRDEEVTDEEFDQAKGYLVDSWPLRLDSNSKLLNMMSLMQNEGLGADYMETWPTRLAAVKKADIQRVAQSLLTPDTMNLIVVGQNEALKAVWPPKTK